MSRGPVISLIALTAVASVLRVPAASAEAPCPDPDDSHYIVPFEFTYPEPHPRSADPLAISPGSTSFRIGHALAPYCDPVPTIARPDGSGAHQVKLVYDGTVTGIALGTDTLDYATGTGLWQVIRASTDTGTVTLIRPVEFRVRRASTVSLAVAPATQPARPVASGVVRYWTYQGVQAPSPGRTVVIRTPDRIVSQSSWVPGTALATTTTDAHGRYSVALPITATQVVAADVPGTSTVSYTYGAARAVVYQPTSLTGRVAPTTATVVRSGTRMSTYGHLRVAYTTGATGGFSTQQVVVQTRPRANPGAGYSTVASAITSRTGYYYANWTARYDADVRVAYLSPYQNIRSSYRWLASLDVH